jgi:hypothetical protein
MTIIEGTELHKRVERYEAAIAELRSAHQDIKDVLLDHVLYERWQQLGAELGFAAAPPPTEQQHQPHRDLAALNHQIPEMSDSWAG